MGVDGYISGTYISVLSLIWCRFGLVYSVNTFESLVGMPIE